MTTLGTLALLGLLAGAVQTSPYAGEQRRSVKALSEADLAALLAGHGAGFAKAAELNHYPGPRHVLDLGAKLGLEPAQRAALEASLARMHAEAVRLGRQLVEAETALDRLFAEGRAGAEAVAEAVAASARLEGELRLVHLLAHIETRAILTSEQVERYDALRGYTAGDEGATGDPHGASGPR